jgi:hypothetical protein
MKQKWDYFSGGGTGERREEDKRGCWEVNMIRVHSMEV